MIELYRQFHQWGWDWVIRILDNIVIDITIYLYLKAIEMEEYRILK